MGSLRASTTDVPIFTNNITRLRCQDIATRAERESKFIFVAPRVMACQEFCRGYHLSARSCQHSSSLSIGHWAESCRSRSLCCPLARRLYKLWNLLGQSLPTNWVPAALVCWRDGALCNLQLLRWPLCSTRPSFSPDQPFMIASFVMCPAVEMAPWENTRKSGDLGVHISAESYTQDNCR